MQQKKIGTKKRRKAAISRKGQGQRKKLSEEVQEMETVVNRTKPKLTG
jgi:hypothetical protein